MNKIIEKGKIVDIYVGPRVSTITLMVKTGKNVYFPSFKFVGTKAAEPGKYKKGDIVQIEGSVRSYAKKQEDGTHKFIQYNRGKVVGFVEDSLPEAFGIIPANTEKTDGINEFEIRGYVKDIRISQGCANMLITPEHDKCSVWVKIKSKEPYSAKEAYPYNSFVEVEGHILTYRPKNQKGKVEQLIVESIFKKEEE